MRAVLRLLAIAVASAVMLGTLAPHAPHHGGLGPLGGASAAFAQVGGWLAALTGSPARPTPFSSPEIDVVVHSRDRETFDRLEPLVADHGHDCSAPPASRALDGRYEDAVFQCRDHVMTAIQAGGYGLIYLTPNQLADFSGGEATIRFDVSTFRSSARDWIDLWVTPYEDNLVAPLDDWLPDLQGEPRRAVHVRLNDANAWLAGVVRGHAEADLPSTWWVGYDALLVPSKAQRSAVEVRLSRARLRVGMPGIGTRWVDAPIDPPLDWGQGVVQLGHHSYNPTKACADAGGPQSACQAGTWHWDNVQIAPAVPFTQIKANERVALPQAPALTFPAPAPAGAALRVHAIGSALEVSLDGGATWAPLRRQAQERADEGHFSTYWHPVPAGTTRALLRGRGWYGGDWRTNYAAIWSRSGAGGTTPAPATPTPPTATPVPPTATSAPPTATAVPPTATPVPPTATKVPPTATKAPPTATKAPPTATSVPPARPSFTTRASVSSGVVSHGQQVTLTTEVTSATALPALIDIEVYDARGAKVHQVFHDNQTFAAGQTRTFTDAMWIMPNVAPGEYTVKVGVFSAGWGTLYSWNDAAARVTVR